MAYEHRLFVYRPLAPESAVRLSLLQQEYASVDSFVPVDDLHLTVFSAYTENRLNDDKFRRAMRNALPVSEEVYENEIVSARIDHRQFKEMARVAVKLMLNDNESDSYFQEQKRFERSFRNFGGVMLVRPYIQPHVTVGYLDTRHGSISLLESAEHFVGTELHFNPTKSNRGPAQARTDVHYPEPPSTPMSIDAPVKVVKPGSIPPGLLASLRPRDSH